MTPCDIVTLLRAYYDPDFTPQSPAELQSVARFQAAGLMYGGVFAVSHDKLTDGGHVLVQMLKDTPFPVRLWADPREVKDVQNP
jgi:hypothetical protein